MNKKLSDIDKRIIEINKRYNLADANGKIKILENALLSYPDGHSEIQDIKKQIEKIKGKGKKWHKEIQGKDQNADRWQ